jgi:hypothetical protein
MTERMGMTGEIGNDRKEREGQTFCGNRKDLAGGRERRGMTFVRAFIFLFLSHNF